MIFITKTFCCLFTKSLILITPELWRHLWMAPKFIFFVQKMHKTLLDRVMRSPMSFFDTTPLGRIVNRFAKDIDVCDNTLPTNIRQVKLDLVFLLSWLVCELLSWLVSLLCWLVSRVSLLVNFADEFVYIFVSTSPNSWYFNYSESRLLLSLVNVINNITMLSNVNIRFHNPIY